MDNPGRISVVDVHIASQKIQIPPKVYKQNIPLTPGLLERVFQYRQTIINVLNGTESRLVLFVGPCSIDDPEEAIRYAQWLSKISSEVESKLFLAMRVYIEKPRSRVGWKGLRRDPNQDGSLDIEKGTELTRRLFRDLTALGIPIATEFVGYRTPQYVGDFVSWAAIGARTTEAQTHRELASGLSMPVGFKNTTSGNIDLAIDSAVAARKEDMFEGIDDDGRATYEFTTGNPNTHIVLRGGKSGPNYDGVTVSLTKAKLAREGLQPRLIIDCSHDNSQRDYTKQPIVAREVIAQIEREGRDKSPIFGLMIESYKEGGNQPITGTRKGLSKTDGCIDIPTTEQIIKWAYDRL